MKYGSKLGNKCYCVSGRNPDGSGPDLADEDCEVCNGTGIVGYVFERSSDGEYRAIKG